jgi:hypothetical protein
MTTPRLLAYSIRNPNNAELAPIAALSIIVVNRKQKSPGHSRGLEFAGR